MAGSNDLSARLDFMRFDAASLGALRSIEKEIKGALPEALDTFYRKVASVPQTRAFFQDTAHMDSAKRRQSGHWDRIARAAFDQDYVDAVTTVGKVHARIGLEPRWYIGGYAVLVETLIARVLEAKWPKAPFGGKAPGAAERGREIGAMVKAALLDMDYAISVYLEASEQARLSVEAKAREVEAAKAAERDKAVAAVGAAMTALAQGDLTYRMAEDIPAEYAAIRDQFNAATSRLHEMVETIKATSGLIAASSQEINSGAEDLSSRTEQQAAALEETAATTEELAASVKTSAHASRQSVELADQATQVAQDGGSIIRKAVEAMSRIEEGSKKISEITTVIDGIAFQTNLLALNAAVEAARAGDAGRGFAVVAAEVRALAQRSADAAKDITGLIASSDVEVTQGVTLVRDAGEALDKIVAASARVSSTVGDISSAAGEQANGIDEMSSTVSHMDGITQQNAALAEQSAASARMLLSQTEQLARLVGAFRTAGGVQPAAAPRRRAA